MITRDISGELKQLLNEYPVVTLLGPRQAGKTTLAKMSLPHYEYINLESPELRQFASSDPKAFLKQIKGKVILDEIQRVPELLSYLQVIVDETKVSGQYVLTGSHQLELREAIAQSLAGRTGILHLLPFSIHELKNGGISFENFEQYAFHGFLPRVYDQKQRPTQAYSNYYQTYVERDIRQLINLKDATLFEKFMKLLAGRVGQLIDYRSLGNSVGVDAKTIKNWLSILEASFIVYKLPPYFENFGKRMVKSPKYYFIDVGLLVFLLGIEDPKQISRDPLYGNIFENLILIECLKARYNQGKLANLYFYRDSNGNEVDVIFQKGRALVPIEIKGANTFNSALVKGLDKVKRVLPFSDQAYLIYNGELMNLSNGQQALPFNEVHQIFK